MMLHAVTQKEIMKILDVTDRLAIHRENVVIPLATRHPGRVRRMPSGKVEIVVDGAADFDQWLSGLESQLRELGLA